MTGVTTRWRSVGTSRSSDIRDLLAGPNSKLAERTREIGVEAEQKAIALAEAEFKHPRRPADRMRHSEHYVDTIRAITDIGPRGPRVRLVSDHPAAKIIELGQRAHLIPSRKHPVSGQGTGNWALNWSEGVQYWQKDKDPPHPGRPGYHFLRRAVRSALKAT